MAHSSDHAVEALARIFGYGKARTAEQPTPRLTIAISRQAGSGGPEVARLVGAQLGWPVYDHELLTMIAKERGVEEKLLEQFDERDIGWLHQAAAQFTMQAPSLDGTYLKQLLTLLKSLGKVGHSVIVGRAAAHVLSPETTLRVRLVASRAARIAHTEKRMGVSRTEAEHWVDRTDREREGFVRHHFHRDPNATEGFDLILNSGRFASAESAAIIVQAARLRDERLQASA